MNSRTIVLTGFMGTGKTTVGRAVAEKLGREFVDMDTIIEARQGQTIPALFEAHGEASFREIESALCAELGQRQRLVIATGGGALIQPLNRAQFTQAFIICLDATTDEILSRIGDASHRPLLSGDDPRGRVQALLDARREAYAQIPFHVDTAGKAIGQVVDHVIALFEAHHRPLTVSMLDGEYPIIVGAGLPVGATLRQLDIRLSRRCAVVTNSTVGSLYATGATQSLHSAGYEPCVIEIPDGERFKTLDTVSSVYDRLIDARLDRGSAILALGGGVVGDLAGFAAATFLRGVPFLQLPTTLLAMVDASIGGKVAVDHPRGKNLVGAFKQPLAVLADTDTLATLPDVEWRSGMAEVVKHGVIADVTLFEELEHQPQSRNHNWLERAIKVKVDIVTRDPFEQNERAKLNLGHTFGHALEKLSNFEFRHGDAVAIGMMCAAHLAVRLGICESQFLSRLEILLGAIGLPTCVPDMLTTEAILDAMMTDKKRADGHLRFILPRALGEAVIVDDVVREQVAAAIDETRSAVG